MAIKNKHETTFPKYVGVIFLALIFVVAISWWVTSAMQAMQPEIREELISALDAQQLGPEKETVAYYWEPELLVAQQLDKALKLNRPENLQMVLENIEQNLQYNRNKPAVYFYLAAAYEQLGKKSKAQELYEAILEKFNNRNILIYGADISEDAPRYSVSIETEAYYRLYLLTGDKEYLREVIWNTFGTESKPGFLYRDLKYAVLDIPIEDAPATWEYAESHLKKANDFLRRYINLAFSEEPESLLAEMVSGSAARTLKLDIDRIQSLKYRDTVTLELDSVTAEESNPKTNEEHDYLYVFNYNEADLKFTVREKFGGGIVIERVQR